MVSVLLSASVERFSVSPLCGIFFYFFHFHNVGGTNFLVLAQTLIYAACNYNYNNKNNNDSSNTNQNNNNQQKKSNNY